MSNVIPFSKIWDYADKMGYDEHEREAFINCTRRLNYVYHKCRTSKSAMSFFGAISS